MSTVNGKGQQDAGVQHSTLAREGADEAAEKVTRLPVQHQVVKETIADARFAAQERVRLEVVSFLEGCRGTAAPVDIVIVYRNPDGSMGYSAPEGDGLAQVGMMEAAKTVLINKMLGVMK